MTQTLTLADFLLARIAEDEEVARGRVVSPWPGEEFDCPCGRRGLLDDYSTRDGRPERPFSISHAVGSVPPSIIGGYVYGGWTTQTLTHELSWEQTAEIWGARPLAPSGRRFLAECEAKRRIVNEWGLFETYNGPDLMMVLAAVYSDHPDYREEWRP